MTIIQFTPWRLVGFGLSMYLSGIVAGWALRGLQL
jgi:site-specific recombinase